MSDNICITTSYTPNYAYVGDRSILTMKLYANIHNMHLHIDRSAFIERPPAWRKILLINELFAKGFDFVFWVDADALFSQFEIDIRIFIQDDKDLYLVEHLYPQPANSRVPNTGVMLLRNCSWTSSFLRSVWDSVEYINHPWWENAAAINLFGYFDLLNSGPPRYNIEVLKHVKFLPPGWNFIPKLPFEEEAIITHFAGYSMEERHKLIDLELFRSTFSALNILGSSSIEKLK